MYEKAPDDYYEKTETEKMNGALYSQPQTFREEDHHKINLYMSAQRYQHGGGEGNSDKLREHDDIDAPENWGAKQLGTQHICADNAQNENECTDAYPLDPCNDKLIYSV